MGERIFALDIGTRSVTGILLEKHDKKFAVVDFYMKEHQERSMRDGQIHNVVAVSSVIQEVKDKLERTHGTLNKVCVAAAGRALKTIQTTASTPLNGEPITETEPIKHLELSAVQSAQLELATQENNNDYANYYCVGYSVLQYKLDDAHIGSLIDQSGDEATVEIIATFLPKVVIESLIAALGRANLEIEALTLEPIAAIHVLIPESMRRLNVALVDIGAGTSDIAITDKGTVVAYGMVPNAGDEITEAISDQYLLDFPLAEQTKRSIVNNGAGTVHDILGFETTISYETLVNDIAMNVESLAASIAEEIIQLNAKQPKAIMLVGGGSLTPEITNRLAQKLQLPDNRVAVRGIDAIQDLIKTDILPAGPDFVTPIGIAIAANQNPVHYLSVNVNGKIIRMFEMKQLTIGDCLVQAGIDIKKLYGKPGMASIISIDGKEITLPGDYGEPPMIYVNGQLETVDRTVTNGDDITLKKGIDGKPPNVTIGEVMGEVPTLRLYVNDQAHHIETIFYVNNEIKSKDYIVQDNDAIVLEQPKTVQDFLENERTEKLQTVRPFSLFVNNKEVALDKGETQIHLNDKKAHLQQFLKQNDRIIIIAAQEPTVKDLLSALEKDYWHTIHITFNGEPIAMKKQQLNVSNNHQVLNEESLLSLHDRLKIIEQKLEPFIFQDVFRYVDLDLTNASGKFQLYKNNQPSTFFDVVEHGDALKIEWS